MAKRTIWYNGDIKEKPAPTGPECSKLISIYQTERLTSGTDELNDKQGRKNKKKVKMVISNNLRSRQREVPSLNPATKEFADFDTSKTPLKKFNKNEKKIRNNSGRIIS